MDSMAYIIIILYGQYRINNYVSNIYNDNADSVL